MSTFIQDVRYGVRMMVGNPGLTVVTLLAVALAVGANTAIFSLVNATLLRPLPYADPDRLVILWEFTPQMETSVAYPNFIDLRQGNTSLEELSASRRESFNLTGAGEPERLQGRMVSASFFATFGARMHRGRDFTPDDDRIGATPVVILSHGLWQRRFGADESVIGRQLELNRESFTVIGVLPPDFRYGAGADVYMALGRYAGRYQGRGTHPGIYMIGRLKPGVDAEAARADLDRVMAALEEKYPDTNRERRIHMESLYENTVSEARPLLLLLLTAVGFVLLIACANLANLLLARATARRREIGIRTALGASRWRIVRQLLTESVLLSLFGGVLGVLVALWGKDFLLSLVGDSLPRLNEATLDARVLGFTLALSLLTGLIFGLAPALQASRIDLNEMLKDADRGSTGRRHWLRSALVVSEVALALVLLVGAGLMLRSFWHLQNVRLGFDDDRLLTLRLSVPTTPREGQQALDYLGRLHQEVREVPGIVSAALSAGLPFAGASENSFMIKGAPPMPDGLEPMAVTYYVGPDYFETMGIRLIRGRLLNEHDRRGAPLVAVVDQALADRYFPGEDPIGRQLNFGSHDPTQATVEIVGLVEHVKHYGLDASAPVEAQIYYAMNQAPDEVLPFLTRELNLVARTAGEPLAYAGGVRGRILSVNANQPVFDVQSMAQRVGSSVAGRRFSMVLLMSFAAVALVLASLGIYGVMSYTVSQRAHEMGIRMALGAEARDVVRLVVFHGMRLALAGVAVGLFAAFLLTRLMESLLFGVSASDPATFMAIALALLGVALAACLAPALRATRVDPMEALRYE